MHARELNAVVPQAQANVRVPEGLDLDARIVPLSRFKVEDDGIIVSGNEEDIENIFPLAENRKKKGKGKGKAEGESGKGKSKGTKKKKKDQSIVDAPIESPEEVAAREKAST